MTESTALAPVAPQIEESAEEVFVFARNQQEMAAAQSRLIEWARRRITRVKAELSDALKNHEAAIEHKWRSEPYVAIVRKAERSLNFHEKLALAFEAGYSLVPDMGTIDLFAIRTTTKRPRRDEVQRTWGQPEQKSNAPAAGKGRYVSPAPKTDWEARTEKDSHGKEVQRYYQWATDFKEFDFPFKLAKTAILTATAAAMALKVFDEIGVLPSRPKADPMVLGRLIRPDGSRLNFVIAWFIDTREL